MRIGTRGRVRALGVISMLAIAVSAVGTGLGSSGDTRRVSLPDSYVGSPAEGHGDSVDPSISADGRYIAFKSAAADLVQNDTNSQSDVFVRDTVTAHTVRASVATSGGESDGPSREPFISADGKFVVFSSDADNLVSGDTNGVADIFVRDLVAGTTSRITPNVANGPAFVPVISANDRYIAFWSWSFTTVGGDANGTADVFRYDRTTGTTILASVSSSGAQGNGPSFVPSISADGNRIAFESDATNLAPSDTNVRRDIFVRDVAAGTTIRASVQSGGGEGTGGPVSATTDQSGSRNAALSSDGHWLSYTSWCTNLVSGDTNDATDIFVTNVDTLQTERVSISSASAQTTTGAGSFNSTISGDGSNVVFQSAASNLVAGDSNGVTDVFVRNRTTNKTTRESLTNSGAQSLVQSLVPTMTPDGYLVVFESSGDDFVTGDANGTYDVFVHELGAADHSAPVVTGTPDRAPNADNWYNGPVTVTWTSVDPAPSSGTPTIPPPTVAATEGKDVTYTSAPSCDLATNCAAGTIKLSIDLTPPAIAASQNSPNTPNVGNWYSNDVLVGFACTDSLSGVASCPAPVSKTLEGANQSVSVVATDRAGNTAPKVVSGINIDRTPPTITFVGGGQVVPADGIVNITCGATDALSGIASSTCANISGPAYLFPPGVNTVVATATDKAGNDASASTTFTVTVDPESIGHLVCGFLGTGYKLKQFCRKITQELDKAVAAQAAGNTKQRDVYLRQFLQTAAKAVPQTISQQQLTVLTQLVQSITGS